MTVCIMIDLRRKKIITERKKSVKKISFKFYDFESLRIFNLPDYRIIPEPFIVCVSIPFCYCHILRQCLVGDTTDIVSLRED